MSTIRKVFLGAMKDFRSFFDDVDVLFVGSLGMRAKEQIGPKFRPQPDRGPIPMSPEIIEAVNQYWWKVFLEERMMMLLPFHNALIKLLDKDPHSIRGRELNKIAKECKKKIKANPDDRDSWLLWASAHAYVDKMNEAEDVVRKALTHNMNFSDAWFMIGALLFGFGRELDASKSIAQALELDPSNELLQKYHRHINIRAQLIEQKKKDSKLRQK